MAARNPDPAQLVRATVARGRTVVGPDGVSHAAGDEVELPAADVERLRSVGFLVDPSAPVIRLDNGPSFGTTSGPHVHRV